MVTITWNSIESLWYLIFTGLMYETPRSKVDKIFRQFNTSSAQRQMIMSIAEVAFSEHPKFLERLKGLNKTTDNLAAIRNNLVHGLYFFDELNGLPGLRIAPMESMNKRKNKLSEVGTQLVTELEKIKPQLFKHEQELDEFRIVMIQHYGPETQRILPASDEMLDSMPPNVRNILPRERREIVVPDWLKSD